MEKKIVSFTNGVGKAGLLLPSRFSRVQLCATPWTAAHHPWDSPGKNTGVGCHFLQINEIKALPHTIHKNKFKKDQRPKDES